MESQDTQGLTASHLGLQRSQSRGSSYELGASLAVPSIASRKAALFKRLDGGNSMPRPTTTIPAILSVPSFTKPDWVKALEEERMEEVTTEKLLPLMTGSTIASTVVDGTSPFGNTDPFYERGSGDRLQPRYAVSKVRLAVQALNALEKTRTSDETSWRVGIDDAECPTSRSLSRMSELTKVGEMEHSNFSSPSRLPRRPSSCYTSYEVPGYVSSSA